MCTSADWNVGIGMMCAHNCIAGCSSHIYSVVYEPSMENGVRCACYSWCTLKLRWRNIFTSNFVFFFRCIAAFELEFLFSLGIGIDTHRNVWVWQIEMWCYSKYNFFFLLLIFLSAILARYFLQKLLLFFLSTFWDFPHAKVADTSLYALSCCSGKHVNDVNDINCKSGVLSIHTSLLMMNWWYFIDSLCATRVCVCAYERVSFSNEINCIIRRFMTTLMNYRMDFDDE